ncbi:DUF3592 domain-containing protein [Desulfosediminicola ganghwensis]|uniref:DUF3592 domain-containing protein n=1 Tax=Desulfosediminicola ganghwensis TaxID=2569540 RepID=UPI0010AB72C6|nr:DUF3592 domain-containing protein [Desulfosediminicola ganghwensis]
MERAIIHLPEVLLSVGLIVLMLKIHLTQRSTSTFAEVVDFEQSENALVGFGDYAGRVQVVNNPKVVFSDHNGRQHSARLDTGEQNVHAEIGDQVSVLYDRTNPGKAMLKNYSLIFKTPVVMVSVGVLCVLVKYTA